MSGTSRTESAVLTALADAALVVEHPLDFHDPAAAVDVAALKRATLLRPEPGRSGEVDDGCVGLGQLVGERVQLR